MMKTFINISADQIVIFSAKAPIFLERNGVDLEIGKTLVALDRESPLEEVLVLNGPWGFTNLRVGTLALNLFKTLKGNQLSFFSLSKLELYELAYRQQFLPRYGVIYIGQKSNVWLRDLQTQTLVKSFKKADLDQMGAEYGEYFLDEVYDESYFPSQDQVGVSFADGKLYLLYRGKLLALEREALAIHPVEKLEPNYMIAPNVS